MANINGWGRGTWGQLTWGEPLPVVITGVAGTTALGSETATGDAIVAVTTVAGTGAVGTVVANGVAIVGVSGAASTVSQGEETVTGGANVYPTTVAGTGAVGTVSTITDNILSITGLAATGIAGAEGMLGSGAGTDTGSIQDFYKTSDFVSNLENRQGFKIACLEEIAYNYKWINNNNIKGMNRFFILTTNFLCKFFKIGEDFFTIFIYFSLNF